MTITIIETRTPNFTSGQIRVATVAITDNGNTYKWFVGNLPLDLGDAQAALDANEAQYLAEAQANGELIDQETADHLGVKEWIRTNPAAKQLFTLSVEDLETEIISLIEDLHPTATAGSKNKLRLLWMMEALSDRVFARRLGLLD